MKRSKRSYLLACLLFCLLAGFLATVVLSHGDPNLLSLARPVAKVNADWHDYLWLSENDIGVLTIDRTFRWHTHDLRSGRVSDMPGINRQWADLVERGLGHQLSPDGRRLLWDAKDRKSGRLWHVADLNGQGHVTADTMEYRCPSFTASTMNTWLSDSRRWVEIGSTPTGPCAFIYPIQSPEKPRHVRLSLPKGVDVSRMAKQSLCLAGVTSRDTLITFLEWTDGAKALTDVTLFEFDLAFDPSTPRIHPVAFPESAKILSVTMSPKGDRLAWTLEIEPRSGKWEATIRSRLPWLQALIRKEEKRIGLWVSHSDGGGMQEVGSVEESSDPEGNLIRDLKDMVRWGPGGKLLSFPYKGRLFVVPTNTQ
jgi:hypothetical protein